MATVKELGRLRYWLESLNDVRKARDVYYKLAEELFMKAVVMIVNTIWNRYLKDVKGDENPTSFALWLKKKRLLENTYHRRFTTRVRRRWAGWQVANAVNKVLTYSPELYDQYGYESRFLKVINEAINQKQPNSQWLIEVAFDDIDSVVPAEDAVLTELQRRQQTIPAVTSLRFNAWRR